MIPVTIFCIIAHPITYLLASPTRFSYFIYLDPYAYHMIQAHAITNNMDQIWIKTNNPLYRPMFLISLTVSSPLYPWQLWSFARCWTASWRDPPPCRTRVAPPRPPRSSRRRTSADTASGSTGHRPLPSAACKQRIRNDVIDRFRLSRLRTSSLSSL